MNYSFEYIDIILLAMIAGFIFLRLRGILGKRTGFEGKAPTQFDKILKEAVVKQAPKQVDIFDHYWDNYRSEFKNITQAQGRINPKLWGNPPPKEKEKKKK